MANGSAAILRIKRYYDGTKGMLARREGWFAQQGAYSLLLLAGMMSLLWFLSFWRVLRFSAELLFSFSHLLLTFETCRLLIL